VQTSRVPLVGIEVQLEQTLRLGIREHHTVRPYSSAAGTTRFAHRVLNFTGPVRLHSRSVGPDVKTAEQFM
jgi:hypothetical protein